MTRSSVPPPVTAVMDAASAWLPARMAVVEDRLAELAGAYGPKLGEEAEATLKAGGKRLRPILVLMAAGDGAGDRAIRVATAVELLHMATLVHDDVLDGAPLRRGRPTVVARSGRDRAVGCDRPELEVATSRCRREVAPFHVRRPIREHDGPRGRGAVGGPQRHRVGRGVPARGRA